MKEIDANKVAWSQISREHYQTFKAALQSGNYKLNAYIIEELGRITDKDVLHLQCNTGADSIALAHLGAGHVLGVDLVPENIAYARQLAIDMNTPQVEFLESDIMTLRHHYHGKHDIVFTSEGVLGWLPDLNVWAQTIRSVLKDDGYLYVFDSHPIYMMFDETRLPHQEYDIKYPYFSEEPDVDDSIGGYASESKTGFENYFWMHSMSSIINALTQAGFHLEYFHEFTENFFDSGEMEHDEARGLWRYPYNTNKFPISFSLKATIYPGR